MRKSEVKDIYFKLKEKHPNEVLLFHGRDFYTAFCKDSVTVSKILGITLTRRNNDADKDFMVAGFPQHMLDTYLPKLIRNGAKVAIFDEVLNS